MGLGKKNEELRKLNGVKRDRDTTWSYVLWITLGGFISLAMVFMLAAILTISLIGVTMATQAFRLGSYLLAGADSEMEPKFEADKVRNTIWMILGGWFLYCFHYLMGGIFYITYVGRPVAEIWFDTAKVVAFPYGLDLEPEGAN